MQNKSLILIIFMVLSSASCQTASLIPIVLVPHEKYSPEQSFWSSGKPVLVSIADSSQVATVASLKDNLLEMTVYVRNTSGSRFDADEKKISLYLFYNQQMHVTPETQCGGGPDSDWNDVPVLDTTLYGWEKGLRSLNKQKLPFVIKAKVFSATEFMKRTEQEFFAEAIIGAVGIGLSSSMYRSETAQAIATHSGIQDLQEGRQQHRSLMKELTTGLFQRHTIWPNSSYMGQVKAKITNSIKIRAGSTQRKNLPSPEYYQICAKFGGQDHTFVFTEEIEEEQ